MVKIDSNIVSVANDILNDKDNNGTTSSDVMCLIQLILSGRCHIMNRKIICNIINVMDRKEQIALKESLLNVKRLLTKYNCHIEDYYNDKAEYEKMCSELDFIIEYLTEKTTYYVVYYVQPVKKEIPENITRLVDLMSSNIYYTFPYYFKY